jgi:hypothetical protein
MTKIWIESAECLVPRKGTQEDRRTLKQEFRKSHPVEAADLEAQPWYTDPDGPHGGDDIAQFNWEWMGEDQNVMCWRTFVPVAKLPLIKKQTLGRVCQHAIDGIDSGDWIDFSFHLKAPYAFDVLRDAGMIPADSVLMNQGEQPLSYDDEELETA